MLTAQGSTLQVAAGAAKNNLQIKSKELIQRLAAHKRLRPEEKLTGAMLAQWNSWPGRNRDIFSPFIAVKTRVEGKVFIEIAGAP